MTAVRCGVCGRTGYLLTESLVEHLLADHSPRAVAEALVRMPPDDPHRPSPPPCSKQRYPSEHAAAAVLVSAWAQGAKGNPYRRERRAYFCESCRAWHLTSQPERTET